MNGFLNINKPPGMTSYDVIRRLKPSLPKTKIGHLGTLDPMARGVLPVAVGWATRVIGHINDNTKEYQAEMALGGVSDTQDRTGVITFVSGRSCTETEIAGALEKFVGEIEQVPPMYSAVHYQGRRLYEWARRGDEVPVKPRPVKIHYITLQEVFMRDDHQVVRFMMGCSPGTYVRTLCHDVGRRLGLGAYLDSLIRTRSGPFALEETLDLESLLESPEEIKSRMLPVDYPLQGMTRVELEPGPAWSISNGSAVDWPGVEARRPYLIYDHQGAFLAIAGGRILNNRGVLQPEKVFSGGKN